MNKKWRILSAGTVLFFVLYLLDQMTKILARNYLAGTEGISLIPGVFELFYLENRGAAFGMLADKQWFFIVVAVIMILLAVFVYVKMPEDHYFMPMRFVCILIAAGAAGNMTDRLIWNFVIDFLYVSLIDFPVFNIADCYVCVGAAAAILLLFTLYREEPFDFLLNRNI